MKEIDMFILEKAGVDFEVILERFSNNTNVYLKFVNKFSQDKNYELFLQSLLDNDMENAMNAIHNIKGVSGNLGFDKLFHISDKIMYKLKSGDKDGLNEMVDELKINYEEVISLIRN